MGLPCQKKLRVVEYDKEIIDEVPERIVHGMNVLDTLSLNKLYTLALAPEEVKEEEY